MRIRFQVLCAVLCIATTLTVGATDTFPSRPIKVIVPFAPGGTTDVVIRILSPGLSRALGQPIVVENKPGAGSTIGTNLVAKALPDGYTLVAVSTTHVISPWLYENLPYDPIKSFTSVGKIGDAGSVLVVNPMVPVQNVQEFVALSKRKRLTYSSSGNGSNQHLMGGLFIELTGAPLKHISYKGSSQALQDLVGGTIDSSFVAIPTALPQIAAGRLRALAVTMDKRASQLPSVPTMREAGVPGYEASAWAALLAPVGTPVEVVKRLSLELRKLLATPEIRKSMVTAGMEPARSTPEEMNAYMTQELDRWGKLVKEAGIKLN